MKTLFYLERKITLSDVPLEGAMNLPFDRGRVFDYVLYLLKNTQTPWINVHHHNLTYLLERFFTKFPLVQASGGLVENPKGEILFIFRHGKWDLPKGKLEQGEDKEQAAIREVIEECGIRPPIHVKYFLGETYQIFESNNTPIIKQTFWFKMNVQDSQLPSPQKEEGIQAALWIAKNHIDEILNNTYQNILLVLKMAQLIETSN